MPGHHLNNDWCHFWCPFLKIFNVEIDYFHFLQYNKLLRYNTLINKIQVAEYKNVLSLRVHNCGDAFIEQVHFKIKWNLIKN